MTTSSGASRRADVTNTLEARPTRLLRVTKYDQASAALIAALTLTAGVVLMLFIVWVSTRVWTKPLAVEPQLIEPPSGGNAMGTARDLAVPGEQEIEDILEPELEQTIDAVTEALSTQLATLDALGGEAAASTSGGGAGDSRQPGPPGADVDLIPRAQRWQILFSSSSLDRYARQLDYFGIELAAAGGGRDTIDYASEFSKGVKRRSGASEDENRIYLTWRFGPLQRADLALLSRARVETDGRVVMQFLPSSVEQRLANVERRYCDENSRTIEDVRRTVFKVKGVGSGYEFFVYEQLVR